MSKKLNRYARRKKDKYLDFVKGCHRKNFRLWKINHVNSKYTYKDIIVSDMLFETNYRYPYKLCDSYFNHKYFNFRYVRIHWLEYPENKWMLYGDRRTYTFDKKIVQRSYEEHHVKNYDYYKAIQDREWNKSHRYDEMELVSTGRNRLHAYLGNIVKEYNSGYEDLTDDKLSDKVDLFDKWDWRY